MNPLEAPEHQGGLMLTEPPYEIEVSARCYWRNTPITVTLKGKDKKTRFRGFAMQPRIFNGPMRGQRTGSFIRLDASGSWQVQCFKYNNSITHSHNEKKTQLTFWWKSNGDETQTIQFVATVVESVKVFWVESVLSQPIPPCKIEREFGPWEPGPITEPPKPSQFKIDTVEFFRTGKIDFNRRLTQKDIKDSRKDTSTVFESKSTIRQQQFRPTAGKKKYHKNRALNHVIPLFAMEIFNKSHPYNFSSAPRIIHEGSIMSTTRIQAVTTRNTPITTRNLPITTRNLPTTTVRSIPTTTKRVQISQVILRQNQNTAQKRGGLCVDKAEKSRCLAWSRFCQQSLAIRQACSRTCRFC
uniref:ShKT domain-containing protein n=1 Tax=Parastrongyloides trichosuri TaxID=131310 RepID=A0A0N4ZSA1_PARTI